MVDSMSLCADASLFWRRFPLFFFLPAGGILKGAEERGSSIGRSSCVLVCLNTAGKEVSVSEAGFSEAPNMQRERIREMGVVIPHSSPPATVAPAL